jgi:leader peptidase (prepilin peptidase) / N-methyltransferase
MEFLLALPVAYQVAIGFGFGVIIGSFLNVVLYRLHTGKSLSGHSHCLSCGKRLRALELIPLFSYVALRGRCRGCGAKIPARYFIVELLTGLLFVGVFLTATELIPLILMLCFVSVLVVVAVYDYRHLIIPDEMVLALTGIAMLAVGYELYVSRDPLEFVLSMGAALLGSVFFYSLWHFSGGKWIGFGDVKLAFPLGLMVGKTAVFSMIVLSFWVGALCGLGILLMQYIVQRLKRTGLVTRRLTLKSALPFAPFLIAGFFLVYLAKINVVTLLTYGI